MTDIKVPVEKKELVKNGREEVARITAQYNDGLLSEEERFRKSD